MTQIEKNKSELERRIKYLDKYKDITETSSYARQELIYFQAFIESLEKEPPQRLDEAAEEYFNNLDKQLCYYERKLNKVLEQFNSN